MSEFGWHHADGHTAKWLLEVYCFVELNILKIFYDAKHFTIDVYYLFPLFFDFFICVQKVREFESFDGWENIFDHLCKFFVECSDE